MYKAWTLLKTLHNYWQQTSESFVTTPIIPAPCSRTPCLPLCYPIHSLIHPIVSVWPGNCVMMCPPPSPTPLLPRNCARIMPNVRHWTCLGRYTNTASHYHNHRYGLPHPLGKPYPTVKLSSLLWNSPCTIKGTMSHLQAQKMKKLNSNCIWKIILIRTSLKKVLLENIFKWENNDY